MEWTLLTLRKHFTVISGLFTGTADPIKVFGGHLEGYWVELRSTKVLKHKKMSFT